MDQRRLFWRCGAICTVANLAGAVFVFVFLVAIAPGDRLTDWVPCAIAFSIYALIAFPLEALWSQRSWDRVLGWVAETRPPMKAPNWVLRRSPQISRTVSGS